VSETREEEGGAGPGGRSDGRGGGIETKRSERASRDVLAGGGSRIGGGLQRKGHDESKAQGGGEEISKEVLGHGRWTPRGFNESRPKDPGQVRLEVDAEGVDRAGVHRGGAADRQGS
jgi:hypothetical protein